MTRLLVTGATGFIGRHVVAEALSRGLEVHAIGRSPVRISSVAWHDCDLLSPGAVIPHLHAIKPSHLVHLAWNATPGQFWSSPDNIDWVAATLQLFRGFAAAGGARAVFAGTCAEYDWSAARLVEDETPLRPGTLYGLAKRATHDLIAAAPSGVSVAWAHLFFSYGPGEPRGKLITDLIHSLLDGQPFETSDGRQERDFIYVKDTAKALIDLLLSEVCGSINIASGECRSVASVIGEIARQTGRGDLVRLGARPSSNEPLRIEADTRRLAALGFKPGFDLAAGIAQTIDACRHDPADVSRR